MRRPTDASLIRAFMRAIGPEATEETRLYFTGGVTAVLYGWRSSTIDLDLRFIPEQDSLFRAIPKLKETLNVNVELASPSDFIPEVPGWQGRSQYIGREGTVSFYHYDFYAQALSKLERGHVKDLEDVRQMMAHGLVRPKKAVELFERIEPQLFRYPAIDPPSFRARVTSMFAGPTH